MKKRTVKISIFIMLALVCSCGLFFFSNNKTMPVYAVLSQDCKTMIGADRNSTYTSNSVVGKIEGVGEYVVGEQNVILTAKAKPNFQIVGFKVTYLEQSVDSERNPDYIWLKDMTFESGIATKELTYSDGSKASSAIITKRAGLPTGVNKYLTEVSFSLDVVFENLTITPVFDHIYSEVDITNLFEVAEMSANYLDWNGKKIYYEQATSDGTATKYSNAYLENEHNFYYYGTIYTNDNVTYYKEHKQITNAQDIEKVDISFGAYRYDEVAKMNFAVKNYYDVQSFDIRPQEAIAPVVLPEYSVDLNEYFRLTKDATALNTTNCEIQVQPRNWSNLYPDTTKVYVTYDKLYVATIQFEVDGVVGVTKAEDFFGEIEIDKVNKRTKSNITINNYFSILENLDEGAKYLIKKSDENGGKSFEVDCVTTISKKYDSTYTYYLFKTLDEETSNKKSFSNPSQDVNIKVVYESIKYQISFELLEKLNDSTLVNMEGESLESVSYIRGSIHNLIESDAKNNIGFRFLGYTLSKETAPEKTLAVTISEEKPKDMVVYLIYEKIEYTIILNNINTVNINSNYPISSLSLDINGNKEKFTNSDTTISSYEFANKIKLNQTLSIQASLNTGFEVCYSLTNPKGDEIISLEITQDFITSYGLENNLLIYVFENVIEYTVTYVSVQKNDPEIGASVIMSNISAEAPTGAVITRYAVDNSEINADDTTTLVAKIVITKLKYKDNISLISEGRTAGTVGSEYAYVFSSYTEKGSQIGLSFSVDNGKYKHSHSIENKNLEIEVRYDMPRTKLTILFNTVDKDFVEGEPLTFEFQFSKTLNKVANTENEYEVAIGDSITITINNIAFGYLLKSYDLWEDLEGAKLISGSSINIITVSGTNTIEFLFERIEYSFEIAKYSSLGELIAVENQLITIKDRKIETEKEFGTYVGKVVFAMKTDVDNYSYDNFDVKLKETNLEGKNNPTELYSKTLSVEDFVTLVQDCGKGVNPIIIKSKLTILPYCYNVEVKFDFKKSGQEVDLPALAYYSLVEGEEDVFINELDPHFLTSVTFTLIQFGTDSKLVLTENLMTGLVCTGWKKDGVAFSDTTNYVEFGKVRSDIVLTCVIEYVKYTLELEYNNQEGSPDALVNEVKQIGNSFSVVLFDKVVINSNANRATAGKQFNKFSQTIVGEVEYIHDTNNMSAWYANFANLYYYEDLTKVVNISAEYDSTKTYYYDGVKNLVIGENSTSLIDEVFLIEDYILEGKVITLFISYVDINFNLNHKVEIVGGKLQNGGSDSYPQYQIHFVEEQVYSFVKFENNNFVPTDLKPESLVFNQQQVIYLKINDKAINGENQDGVVYDLTLGVELQHVKVHNYILKWQKEEPKNFEVGEVEGFKGVYKICFMVTGANSEHIIDAVKNDIEIIYTLNVEQRKISMTTQVTDSNFYKSGIMIFRPNSCGWGADSIPSSNASLKHELELQFLASTVARMSWTEASGYKGNFEASGVEIFMDGVKVAKVILLADGTLSSTDDYAKYGIEVSNDASNGLSVAACMLRNIDLIFYIQPKITLVGAPFEKEFKCDGDGNGVVQTIDDNIVLSDWFKANADLAVVYTLNGTATLPINVSESKYNIEVSFKAKTSEYSWIEQMPIAEGLTLTILPKKIWLAYEKPASFQTLEKLYDRKSSISFSSIAKYLRFSDKDVFIVNYNSITGLDINVLGEDINTITASGTKSGNASDLPYDVLLEKFTLSGVKASNFALQNSDLTLDAFVKINKVNLKLSNVDIKSKVYDGSKIAQIKNPSQIVLEGKLPGDDLDINVNNLEISFLNADEGIAKVVSINGIKSAIFGESKDNYNIQDIMQVKSTATIYPYSMTTNVRGVGTITITNKRGLTDETYVDLIKLNSRFTVDVIYSGSNGYRDIFKLMSHRFSKNNEFFIAYQITVYENEKPVALNKDLYITVPNIRKLTGAFFISGAQEGELSYTIARDGITIDLRSANLNIDKLVFTQQKILLKVWQIVLIILLFIALIVAVVLMFVLIRRRKKKDYSVHEKI